MNCIAFENLNNSELMEIDGGSVFKYILGVGTICFGIYEVSTGIGAVHGAKNIVTGILTITGGVLELAL